MGDYLPDCPSCEEPMILRTNRNTGEEFYGCVNYPECRETVPVVPKPEYPAFCRDRS